MPRKHFGAAPLPASEYQRTPAVWEDADAPSPWPEASRGGGRNRRGRLKRAGASILSSPREVEQVLSPKRSPRSPRSPEGDAAAAARASVRPLPAADAPDTPDAPDSLDRAEAAQDRHQHQQHQQQQRARAPPRRRREVPMQPAVADLSSVRLYQSTWGVGCASSYATASSVINSPRPQFETPTTHRRRAHDPKYTEAVARAAALGNYYRRG